MYVNTDATIPNDKILMPASGDGMYATKARGAARNHIKVKAQTLNIRNR